MKRHGRVGVLDTNVLLRHLLGDDPDQSPRAHRLMRQLQEESRRAELQDVVIAETVWVLEKGLGVPRKEIASHLLTLLSLRGLLHRAKEIARDALECYARTDSDIVDCLLAAQVRERGGEVCTFDNDFDRLGCPWQAP